MKYRIELLGAVFSVSAGLVAALARSKGVEFEVYIPAVIGFLVTASAVLVKREIVSHLHLLRTVAEIEDADLQQHAMRQIQDCAKRIEDIRRGIRPLDPDDFFSYIIGKMNESKKSVQAIHLANDLESMLIWERDPGIKNYYYANCQAVKRGVKVQRVFLLDSSIAHDDSVAAILKKQKHDGIDVSFKILKPEEQRREEFVLFDEREVQVNDRLLAGRYARLSVARGNGNVLPYVERFENLKNSAHSLAELPDSSMASLDPRPATQPGGPAVG